MKTRAVGAIIAILVVASLGAGYLAGTSAQPTKTVTSTATLTSQQEVTSTVVSTATWTETTYFPTPSTGQLGPWNSTTDYPLPLAGVTCVADGGFAYCVGGGNETAPRGSGGLNLTYYAPLSPTGVGQWTRTTDYPLMILQPSCVASLGYIYCVSGFAGPTSNLTADVFYAPLSPSGIGAWKPTTPFDNVISPPPCMVDSSYIYCVTQNATGPFLPAGNTYFAHLSAAGVGNWTGSSQVPDNPEGCVASGGYGYCFGGACPSSGPCTQRSYYAPLSPNGVGAWTLTTDLPNGAQVAYAAGGSYVYLLTPTPLLAQLSSSGIGPWTTTTPYPEDIPAGCFINGAYLYCVGSDTIDFTPSQNVYFAAIG